METLRAYGLDRLADGGEQAGAAAALARYALRVAEQADAGMQTSTGELAAARLLDAEDATMAEALGWALEHDPAAALRLAIALAPWWALRGRLVAGYALLRAAAGHAPPDGEAWCAAQLWLGHAVANTGDFAGALGHYTAARDAAAARGPSPALALGPFRQVSGAGLAGPDPRSRRRCQPRPGRGRGNPRPGRRGHGIVEPRLRGVLQR